jgi:hypothetical protein
MLDINKDFEITSKIKFISGAVDQFNGLFWGDLIFGDKMFFGFSSMGEIVIKKISGFTENVIFQKKIPEINRTDFNLLSVIKVGNQYYFYINDQKVYQMPFEQFSGRYFGFSIAPKSYIQIAFLKIWYLQK